MLILWHIIQTVYARPAVYPIIVTKIYNMIFLLKNTYLYVRIFSGTVAMVSTVPGTVPRRQQDTKRHILHISVKRKEKKV